MNVYLIMGVMRIKDEIKREALFEATVKVVSRTGLASSSVSKIAKEAGVSPATLYIYYKNKEDLLLSTYLNIKCKIGEIALKGIDDDLPIRDSFRQAWFNLFRFTVDHPAYFNFAEQFSNSPFLDKVNQADVDRMYLPLGNLIRRGIERKIIKDVGVDIIGAFIIYPIIILSNPKLYRGIEITEEAVEQSFQLAWDAIKL